MLHLHFSNRTEALTARLLDRLAASRGGVFDADQLVVPSAAVQRSLTLAIARQRGICANLHCSWLAPWLWQQTRNLLPGLTSNAPFDAEVLAWRIHAALGDAAFVGAHPRLSAYLDGADPVMRHELATRAAVQLEQTGTYRPDWIEAWQQGRSVACATETQRADERWQAALWRRLASEWPALAPASALLSQLQALPDDAGRAAGLPAAAHVFALPAMPPLHVDWLLQIGRLVELHVYVLNPCQAYWFEVVDRRRLSHLVARGAAEHHEEGNRLLAAWGRQTQAHVDTLVDRCGDAANDDGAYVPNEAGSLLAQWQNAVLELRDLAPGEVVLEAGDRSIELHVCHSLTRELEVLQDHLLGLFASGAVTQPSQVLVVTPDLEAAAPLIEAVFGTAPAARRIPFTVTGLARSRSNAAARALLALLALAASRCTASALVAVLQQDMVARRFGLDADALQQVHDWVRGSGARWGLDAAHRAGFGVPATSGHTWAQALDRLFLGYALPTQVDEPFAGLLPAGDAEGSAALALGAFQQFIARLQALQAVVAAAHAPTAWRRLLLDTVADFLHPAGDELDDLVELQAAIGGLTATMQRAGLDATGAEPLPLAVLRSALERQLDDPARGGVPGGGVTFSSMSSLRGLPFAVVCVIGLNDGAFPGPQRPAEFDLIAAQPRRGDRQRRNDERNLFLDLLLAARHSVVLSHTGRSVRDNAPLPPSVLVAELLDVLLPAIAAEPASPDSLAQARRRLVVEHPLQPFAVEGFSAQADPRLRSFNAELAQALRSSLQAPADAPTLAAIDDGGIDRNHDDQDDHDVHDEPAVADPLPPFFRTPLPPPDDAWRTVSLAQLGEFFRNPCRFLLRRRLGIGLWRADEELQDDEPFLPDWSARTALAARLLGPLIDGAEPAAVRRLAEAGTELPEGALGRQQLDRTLDTLQAFAALVRAQSAAPCLPPHTLQLGFDIDGEDWRLDATLGDLRPQGLLRWRFDELRPTDVLSAWLAHLALCAAQPPGVAGVTQWLALDQTLTLQPVTGAFDQLRALLALYRRGLREPLHFFPKAAWSYVTNEGSMSAASRVWTPTRDRAHAEGADPAYRLALRGKGDVLDEAFATLANAVFGPVLVARRPAA